MSHIKLTSPQHTPAGKVLHDFYYGGIDTVLDRSEYSGYPHNGGEHTLYLDMSKQDAHSLLDLIEELIPHHHDGIETLRTKIDSTK